MQAASRLGWGQARGGLPVAGAADAEWPPPRVRVLQPCPASDLAAQACSVAIQVLILLLKFSKSRGSLGMRLAPACVLASKLALLAFMALRPNTYWRHRVKTVLSLRVATCLLMPGVRSTGVGAGLLLDQEPRPGLWGAAVDLLNVSLAMRVLPQLVLSCFIMLPPTATLLLHTVYAAVAWDAARQCATPLLSSPLSQQRQAGTAAALELFAVPLVAVQPVTGKLIPDPLVMQGQAPAEALCQATVSFLHICLCWAAPIVLTLYSWHPPAMPEGLPAGQPGGEVDAPEGCGAQAALQRLDRWLCGCRTSSAPVAMLGLYCLLANCWLLCRMSAAPL